jgi:hypothetical protein
MALDDLIAQFRERRLRELVSDKKTRKKEPSVSIAGTHVEKEEREGSSDAIRAAVYKKIIERYADVIGLQEEKTIPELKALVNPEDEAIAKVKSRFLEEVKGNDAAWEYSFERDFPFFARKALAFCYSLKQVNADLNVSYWLKPSEIVELQAADPFDKAIFLCSLLISGGGNAKVRVLELEGNAKHAVVLLDLNEKKVLLDPSCSSEFEEGNSEEEVLEKHSLEGKRILRSVYEFNHSDYADFEE